MRTLLGFALLLSIVPACGDDLEGETLIGATCKESNECDVTGVCVIGGDGLCSLKCQFAGRAQQCPLGSYCDDRVVETADETLQPMTLCFPACQRNADCRSGFECKNVTTGAGKVCVPNEDVRDE
jgi:hypothetical protein